MTTASLITAAAKTLAENATELRGELRPGTYELDEQVVVHVKGTLTVSEDETYKATTSVPMKSVLALFMHYSGVTGDAATSALEKAMAAAMSGDLDKDVEILSKIKDIDARAKAVAKVAAMAVPTATRKGKVSFKAAE